MKKLTALLLALCLLLSCAWAEETAEEERRDVVVLFTNDVHCGISQNWGYAGLYAVRE